jgi:hypothetical protein
MGFAGRAANPPMALLPSSFLWPTTSTVHSPVSVAGTSLETVKKRCGDYEDASPPGGCAPLGRRSTIISRKAAKLAKGVGKLFLCDFA